MRQSKTLMAMPSKAAIVHNGHGGRLSAGIHMDASKSPIATIDGKTQCNVLIDAAFKIFAA
jgi:hypothetical protein